MHTVRAFGGLSIENRFPILEDFFLNQIKTKKIDCFALQEIDEKAKQLLEVFFKRQGFDIFFTQYCPHKDAYYYAFAYNPILYTAKCKDQIYFTLNGLPTSNEERAQLTKEEKMHRHLEQEFEKSAQVIQLTQRQTLMHRKSNKEILLVNLQAGTVPNSHRELAMDKLGKALANEDCPILLVGDFNQFDACVKESKIHSGQIDILKRHGFNWNSESILYSGKGMHSTFFAFPHDIDRFLTVEDKNTLNEIKLKEDYEGMRLFYLDAITRNNIHLESTCLDAVYDKNFPLHAVIKTKPITQLSGKTINTSKISATTFQENVLMGYRTFFSENKEQNNKPPLPSDHFSLRVKVNF